MTYCTIRKDQLQEIVDVAKQIYEQRKDEQWCTVSIDCALDEAEAAIKNGQDPAILAARINFQAAVLHADIAAMQATHAVDVSMGMAFNPARFDCLVPFHEAAIKKMLAGEQ